MGERERVREAFGILNDPNLSHALARVTARDRLRPLLPEGEEAGEGLRGALSGDQLHMLTRLVEAQEGERWAELADLLRGQRLMANPDSTPGLSGAACTAQAPGGPAESDSTSPERCTCGSTAPDEFGNRDQIENPDCPVHGDSPEQESRIDPETSITGDRWDEPPPYTLRDSPERCPTCGSGPGPAPWVYIWLADAGWRTVKPVDRPRFKIPRRCPDLFHADSRQEEGTG